MKKLLFSILLFCGCTKTINIESDQQRHIGQCGIIIKEYNYINLNGWAYKADIDIQFSGGFIETVKNVQVFGVSTYNVGKKYCQ